MLEEEDRRARLSEDDGARLSRRVPDMICG
jgi:hypothetical protein